MKVYTDDSNINILQSIASASTLISSLANVAKEYIVSKFSKDYFKHIYIDTSETVIQQNRNSVHNNYANKIPYPSMSISPEISLDDPIGGMEKSMHLSSPNLYMRRDAIREYRKLVVDPDEKFSLLYTGDYITTNFNFKIATNTFIQNADIAFWLKSKFQANFFQYLNNQHLQTEIPKSFIKFIANVKGWNLNNPDDMDALRLYLIGTGMRPTTIYKRKSLSTGKECFFIDDSFNLLVLLNDIDCPPSINRESQVESEYTITFRLQVSTYLTNAFILSFNKSALKKVSAETFESMTTDKDQFEEGQTSALSISLDNKLTRKDVINFRDNGGNEQIGTLIYKNTYFYDINKKVPNLYILESLPEEFLMVHSYAINKLNIDASSLIHVKLYYDGGEMPNRLYAFDPDFISLEFYGKMNYDFAIAVYVNRLLYESILKAMKEDKDYFSSGFLTNVLVNIGGETLNVVVNKFKNKDEFNKSDAEHALRIRTPYGIGYVALLDDSKEDGYKICLGNDDYGEKIIKRLKIQL